MTSRALMLGAGSGLLLVAALFVLRHNQTVQPEVTSMKMATVFFKSAKELDPSKILSMEEYELVQNLHSSLVEYDINQNLQPGVAKSFVWEGDDLVFEFDPKRVVTVEGDSIDAEDAARSLKRSVLYGGTGHGDLRTFLCPGQKLKSIDDACPGIQVRGGRLILTPVRAYYKSHLVKILANADYAILPRKALGPDPADPVILNHRNTSGPYYLDKDDASGAWTLKINPDGYHFHPEMPQSIELVPTDYGEAPARLLKGDFDYLAASAIVGGEDFDRVLDQTRDFNFHESMAFRIRLICFSPRALKDFSPAQRFYGARLMQGYLKEQKQLRGSKPTVEYFQALSEGTLSESQRQEISALRQDARHEPLPRPFTIGGPKDNAQKLRAHFKDVPEIQVLELADYPYGLAPEQRPDIYVVSSDSAWTESLASLGHNFEAQIFQLPGLDGGGWLRDYIETSEKDVRLSKLKQLHFDLLKNAAIYPVTVSSYYTVARKPWTLGFSTFSSGTELWQVRKEP